MSVFVPGVGLTSSTSSSVSTSGASGGAGGGGGGGSGGSVLAASAREFIPSNNIITNNEEEEEGAASTSYSVGMNSSASEWHPSSNINSKQLEARDDRRGEEEERGDEQLSVFHSAAQQELYEQQQQQLVEVEWFGAVYLVPASLAYGVAELTLQHQQLLDHNLGQLTNALDGLEWTRLASGVPTPRKRSLQMVGVPEPLREHFSGLDLLSSRQLSPDDERYKEIPPRYHSAFPLDDNSRHRGAGGSFGYPSSVYKVVDKADGQLYTLRRFDNVRSITSSVLSSAQARWTAVRHPSIVSLYSISVERGAVFFAHAYHPGAQTVQHSLLSPKNAHNAPVSESLLWRLIGQLLSGIRNVHSRNMAVRSISASHVLLTSGTRFRFANVGVMDVLEFESRKTLLDMQREDLFQLGLIALSVASRVMISFKDIDSAMTMLQQHFSHELYETLAVMISGTHNAQQVCAIMSSKMCDELDLAMASSDALHLNLQNEYENGRLLRLLFKLGFINERPEHSLSPSWSETGDRYVLKLFRDYLFHQTDVDGLPQMDMGHVVSALNKLDMADDEQILLSSRNGKDILVASFRDINRCLESAFVDLTQQSGRGTPHQHQTHSGRHLGQQEHFMPQQRPIHHGRGVGDTGYLPPTHPYGVRVGGNNSHPQLQVHAGSGKGYQSSADISSGVDVYSQRHSGVPSYAYQQPDTY